MLLSALLLGLSVATCPFLTTAQQPTCAEHFTCMSADRRPEHLQLLKLNASVPNWYELCSCDSFCHLFGDCCSDAPVLRTIELDQWSFVKVRLTSKITYLSLMKNKCPRTWKAKPDNSVKQLCENSPLSPKYDYMLPDVEHQLLLGTEDETNNWHVTSRTSMVTYRNLHCSVCNEDSQVEAWHQRLKCSPEKDPMSKTKATIDHCTAVSTQTSPEILGKEKLKRTLLQKVYSNCNLGWYKMNIDSKTAYVTETVKKCLIFYEPVVVKDPKSKKYIIFKNRYCALCNDYEASVQQCASEAVDQQTQVPPVFNHVLDFDTNYRKGGFNQQTNSTCSAGEVYNPLISTCQKVIRSSSPSFVEDRLKAAGALSKVSSSASSLSVPPFFTDLLLLLLTVTILTFIPFLHCNHI